MKKLQIGCGNVYLNGWINSDILYIKNLDIVFDATKKFPFFDKTFRFIFAEHFIEHLTEEQALLFLKECYRILIPNGALRLSTPNLDWVWITHYQLYVDEERKRHNAKILNRAFYGWGHKNLYNNVTICDILKEAGFDKINFFKYGESEIEELKNLEKHPKDEDTEELPCVLILQAYKI